MQCQCTTNLGKQCQRTAETNSDYCWQHRNCKTKSSVGQAVASKSKSAIVKQSNTKKSPVIVKRRSAKKRPVVVKRRSAKKRPVIVKRREKIDQDYVCSKKIPTLVRSKIVSELKHKDVNELCQTSKACNENICKNNKMWDMMSVQKYGKNSPKGARAIDFYYGKSLYECNDQCSEFTQMFADLTIKDYGYTPGLYGIVDYDSNLTLFFKKGGGYTGVKKDYTEKQEMGKVDKIYLTNYDRLYVLVDNILYKLDQEYDRENNKFYYEKVKVFENIVNFGHDGDETYWAVMDKGLYIGQKVYYRPMEFADKSQKSQLKLDSKDGSATIIIDGVVRTKELKYIQIFGSRYNKRHRMEGIMLFENGDLYTFFVYKELGIQYNKISSEAQLAKFCLDDNEALIVYWVDTTGVLHRFNDIHFAEIEYKSELPGIVAKYQKIYNLSAPVIKLVQVNEEFFDNPINDDSEDEDPIPIHDTVYIQTADGNLYVDNHFPRMLEKKYKIKKWTPLENPMLILENVYDFTAGPSHFNVLIQN